MPRDRRAQLSLKDKLKKLYIRPIEQDIFEMSRAQLREQFGFANGGLNSSELIANLIWQDLERVRNHTLPQVFGNIRSYWYSRVKPVLSRGKAKKLNSKYSVMTRKLSQMVVSYRLFDYVEFGFVDHRGHNRKIGGENRHIFCVAEKMGHMPLLDQLHNDHDMTIIALGGQPSSLSSEYFLRELTAAGFELDPDPEVKVPVLTVVDFDPSGDSIADSFIVQLEALGFEKNRLLRVDLVHPSRMSEEQIHLNKYQLSQKKKERKKNKKWMAKTGGLSEYQRGFYGLEADAMTWDQLKEVCEEQIAEHSEVPKEQIIRRRLNQELADTLRDLLLFRLGIG